MRKNRRSLRSNRTISCLIAALIVILSIMTVFVPPHQAYGADQTIAEIFPDDYLAKEMANILNKNENTSVPVSMEELQSITGLVLIDKGIQNITGLERLTQLEELDLTNNQIKDISLLKNLVNLNSLSISYNKISDISPLKALHLKGFEAGGQQIYLSEGITGNPTYLVLAGLDGSVPNITFKTGQGNYNNNQLIWNTAGQNVLTWNLESDNSFNGTVQQTITESFNFVPELTIDVAGPIYLSVGEEYLVKGTWKDLDHPTNTITSELNGIMLGTEVLDNGGELESLEWSYPIHADELNLGENNLVMTLADPSGGFSNVQLTIIVESPPSITFKDANKEVTIDNGAGYSISGTWKDLDSDEVDLYYVLGKKGPIMFADNVLNDTDKGNDIDFEFEIPAELLSIGTHKLQIYAIDDTDRQSNVRITTLKVIGELKFDHVPDNVSFDDTEISGERVFSKRSDDWGIVVLDTRGNGSSFRLTATLTDEFTNSEGQKLENALKFIDNNGDEINMEIGIATKVYEAITEEQQIISVNWEEDKGPLLLIEPYVYKGQYTASINWNLIDAP
ncbi:leucine-rich repeat domain-containing protein (plasmid) [Niallia taxi]|uniref:leucine-rich repeat domain-containing protein n=1 Tax=Niallia taxi TaxID=2499688 RepID=UPI0029344078|nr:leucine-rich repeat domain-containing protein [Niallia taxi]WOD64882.1 leucine-rich repeat domain-containing protein [Niallia taxi]